MNDAYVLLQEGGASPPSSFFVRQRSRDGGATWAPLASDLPAASIHCLEADPRNPRHLVACTEGGGLLEIRLSD
jgi:hypothetical protein